MGCLYVLCLYYSEVVFVHVCWKSHHEWLKLLGSSDRRQLIQPSYFMSARMDVPRWSRCLISPAWTVPVISNHKSSSFPGFALRYVGFVNVFFFSQIPCLSFNCQHPLSVAGLLGVFRTVRRPKEAVWRWHLELWEVVASVFKFYGQSGVCHIKASCHKGLLVLRLNSATVS